MSFPSTAICFTFIPLSLFFWVLADSLEWTCLAPNYKLLTLKLLHYSIPKQNLHHLSSKTDSLQVPHYATHAGSPGLLTRRSRQALLLGLWSMHMMGRGTHGLQCLKPWTSVRKLELSPVIHHPHTFWEMKMSRTQGDEADGWEDSILDAEQGTPWGGGPCSHCLGTPRQLSAAGHQRENHIMMNTPSVRSYQPWKMTMANICELLWVFNILLPCSNPCRQEGQGVITQSDRWGNCKIWRGWEICPHPQHLGGGGKVECPALGSSVFGNFKLTVRSSISKCWATTSPEADAGLDAGGMTHTSITHELWPSWAQKTLQYFVQGPEGVGQPLSTKANERRARRRILPVRGRAWAGWKVWGTSMREMGVGGEGWEGTGVSGDQGEENRMERVAVTSVDQVKEETEKALSWKQDSILGRTVDFELYAQYLWKRHTNWKTSTATPPTPTKEEPQGSPSPKRMP